VPQAIGLRHGAALALDEAESFSRSPYAPPVYTSSLSASASPSPVAPAAATEAASPSLVGQMGAVSSTSSISDDAMRGGRAALGWDAGMEEARGTCFTRGRSDSVFFGVRCFSFLFVFGLRQPAEVEPPW
jgi:hypothetical protein